MSSSGRPGYPSTARSEPAAGKAGKVLPRLCAALFAWGGLALLPAAASVSAMPAGQQQSGTPAAAPGQAAGEPAPAVQDPEPATHGKVLFSRSDSAALPAQAAAETAPPELAASITDAMRAAPLFTRYNFSIHLAPAAASLAVELHATVRNGSSAPLATLPLQLGSALHFEHIRAGGQALRFAVHPVDSDADSSGVLAEAAVALPQPLAPRRPLSS